MRGIGYWWDLVSRWTEEQFDTWLAGQGRQVLIDMLQETDPNGIWTDELAEPEIGHVTSLETAREQMKTFWKESTDGIAH